MVTRVLTRNGPKVIEGVQADAGLAFVDTDSGRISLTLHRSFDDASSAWQTLPPATHAQTFACAKAWFEEVSRPSGAEAVIITGRSDSGKPLFVWPFEVVKKCGLRALQWIGQDLGNYNMGLFDPHFARTVQAADIRSLLCEVAVMAGDVSITYFRNQPIEWEGEPNPFATLPHQRSPNRGYAVLLDQDFDTLYRNRFSGRTRNSLQRKERKLRCLGELEYGWASNGKQRQALLKEFFEQKTAWFAKHGISDLFANPGYRTFFQRIAELPEGTPGRLELGYLKVGDSVAATFHGAKVGGRFHMLLSSIAPGESERWSPGILLMRSQIENLCGRGCLRYDLGSGHAQHKSEWSDEEIALFDSFIALDENGYVLTIPMSLVSRAKRLVKNNKTLWAIAQVVRRKISRPTAGTA